MFRIDLQGASGNDHICCRSSGSCCNALCHGAKSSFSAERTGETIRLAFPGRCFRRPWMTAPLALVFLMPIFIFSEAIKIGLIVYFRVVDLA